MFTFHWSELLVIVLGGLVLFFGLALLMLRRRNEMLKTFLTPEEPNLEQDFFRVRKPKPEETPPKNVAAEPEANGTTEADAETTRWGTTSEITDSTENDG